MEWREGRGRGEGGEVVDSNKTNVFGKFIIHLGKWGREGGGGASGGKFSSFFKSLVEFFFCQHRIEG